MKKYVIKNCPNLTTSYYGTGETIHNQCGLTDDDLCANCTDCLLKQIVEKCRNVECDCIVDKNKCGAMDNMPVCCDLWRRKDILGFLNIQEVE